MKENYAKYIMPFFHEIIPFTNTRLVSKFNNQRGCSGKSIIRRW
ncbi:hypothetical protein EC900091_5357, partial [Escherichia coli 90.0091]